MNLGIGVATQTYCGEFRFNGVVDPKVFNQEELQAFLDDIISEMYELAKIYGADVGFKTLTEKLDENGNGMENRANHQLEYILKSNDLNNSNKKAVVEINQRINMIGKCIQSL